MKVSPWGKGNTSPVDVARVPPEVLLDDLVNGFNVATNISKILASMNWLGLLERIARSECPHSEKARQTHRGE
jgi:hypothetical protein